MPPESIEVCNEGEGQWAVLAITRYGKGSTRRLATCPSQELARTFAALYRIGGCYSADALENNRWELQVR